MTKYHIVLYTNDLRDTWEAFLQDSNNSTMFHSQSFFDYHPADRFDFKHILIYDAEKLVALLTGAVRGEAFVSCTGASYGGFVLPVDSSIKQVHEIVNTTLNWLKEQGFKEFRLTPPPLFYTKIANNHLEFVLMKNGFTMSNSELTSIVHFQENLAETFSFFRPTARTSTRKAEKEGVTISFSDDFKSFYEILESNLAMRHNVKPTHSLDELQKLKDLMPDNVHQLCAFYKGKMIAGVTIFVTNPRSLLAFYISHNPEYQKLRSLNLLFYKLIEWGIEGGFDFLDFGTFTLNMEPNFGLARFKEGFGARGLLRTTWALRF